MKKQKANKKGFKKKKTIKTKTKKCSKQIHENMQNNNRQVKKQKKCEKVIYTNVENGVFFFFSFAFWICFVFCFCCFICAYFLFSCFYIIRIHRVRLGPANTTVRKTHRTHCRVGSYFCCLLVPEGS